MQIADDRWTFSLRTIWPRVKCTRIRIPMSMRIMRHLPSHYSAFPCHV